MIYSASRRSDMVAFCPDLIVAKIHRSKKLQGIVYWTKDPRNLVFHPALASVVVDIPSVVQLTITGLGGSEWEPGVPPFEVLLPAVADIASRLPAGAIKWRFDPIMAGPGLLDRFRFIKKQITLALGSLTEVTVSFPDPYRKAVARSHAAGLEWPQVNTDQKREIIIALVKEFGPESTDPVKLCCEPDLLSLPGVGQARCVDSALFESLYNLTLGGRGKDPGQRKACGCVKSTDIGSYDMICPHRCRYCYATPEV